MGRRKHKFSCPSCGEEINGTWTNCLDHIHSCCPAILGKTPSLMRRCRIGHVAATGTLSAGPREDATVDNEEKGRRSSRKRRQRSDCNAGSAAVSNTGGRPTKRSRRKQPDRDPVMGNMPSEEERAQSLVTVQQDDIMAPSRVQPSRKCKPSREWKPCRPQDQLPRADKDSAKGNGSAKGNDSVRRSLWDRFVESMKCVSSHVLRRRQQNDRAGDDIQAPLVEPVTGAQVVEEIRRASKGEGASLLVITSDASGGKEICGIAAILRQCASRKDNNDGMDDNMDDVLVVTDAVPYGNTGIAEAEAIAMGLREAKLRVPKEERQRIIVLSDSIDSLKRMAQSGHKRRVVQELLQDSSNGIGLCHTKSNHSKNSGFFDHEAADLLAATAKKDGHEHMDGHCVAAQSLGEEDLDWLECPSTDKKSGGEEGRIALCKARMERDLCIQLA